MVILPRMRPLLTTPRSPMPPKTCTESATITKNTTMPSFLPRDITMVGSTRTTKVTMLKYQNKEDIINNPKADMLDSFRSPTTRKTPMISLRMRIGLGFRADSTMRMIPMMSFKNIRMNREMLEAPPLRDWPR